MWHVFSAVGGFLIECSHWGRRRHKSTCQDWLHKHFSLQACQVQYRAGSPRRLHDSRLHVINPQFYSKQRVPEKSITGYCPALTSCQACALVHWWKAVISVVNLHMIIALEDALTWRLLIFVFVSNTAGVVFTKSLCQACRNRQKSIVIITESSNWRFKIMPNMLTIVGLVLQ